MPSHVVLIGMMGSGKTTVGRVLAESVGRQLRDSDAMIEAATGRTVREIFATDGEPAFRVLETEALTSALAEVVPVVVAGAGGIVLAEKNRALLHECSLVIWLRCDPAELARRVMDGSVHRPLLGDDPLGVLQKMYVDRKELYTQVATHIIDVDGRRPQDIAEEVRTLMP